MHKTYSRKCVYYIDIGPVVTLKDIEENNFSLSIPLYVKYSSNETELDNRSLDESYESWRTYSEMMKLSYMKLNDMIGEEGKSDE